MKIHITKQGESLEILSNHYAVSKQDLIGINPHVNLASDLVPGLKLKIPDTNRADKLESFENFYPKMDASEIDKEKAVPIGLKPYDTTPEVNQPGLNNEMHFNYNAPHEYPWGQLNENMSSINTDAPTYHPWANTAQFAHHDARAFMPPVALYPPYPPTPYPYSPLSYPGYGYGAPLPLPIPIPVPSFGYHGHNWGGYGYHGGFHGGHHHHR